MNNCIECRHHIVVNDPDPNDWFCYDDVAVLCKLSENTKKESYYDKNIGLFEYRPITLSCRPHYIYKEAVVPEWCPLIKEN